MRKFLTFLLVLVFLAGFAICEAPYLNLQPGSFLGSVLLPLNELAKHYVGFIPTGSYADYTLLPAVLLLWFTASDVGMKTKFRSWLAKLLIFIGLYFLGIRYLGPQGYILTTILTLDPIVWFASGVIFCLGGLSIILVSFSRWLKYESLKRRNKEVEEEAATQEEEPEVEKMPYEEALASLSAVYVPEFANFSNVQVTDADGLGSSINRGMFGAAFEDGNIHRSAYEEQEARERENREKINEVFRPTSIKRKLDEEARASLNFPSFDSDKGFDIQNPHPAAGSQPQQPQVIYVQQPAPQPQVIYVQQPAPPQPQVIYVNQNQQPSNAQDAPSAPSAQPAVPAEPVEPVQEAPKPVAPAAPAEPRPEPEAIIDEGTDGEEELESAHEAYRKMKEAEEEKKKEQQSQEDYVSGIGGLKRSPNGYLYNAKRFLWKFPPESYLRHYETSAQEKVDIASDMDGQIIVQTYRDFRIETELLDIQRGPTFTLYELALSKGIKLNSVITLADNLALELAVSSVRILAPIPGKRAFGVEVPNKKRDTIGFDVMMGALKRKPLKIPMVLGRTITGESIIIDLAGAPHLLIAGTTGSGKSVCVNSLICSVLYTKSPKEVRMLLVDPKMVELSMYNNIAHLLTPVITEPKKAIKAMAWVVYEMERRMSMFSQVKARKIEDYNQKIKDENLLREPLPYIMVIVDEFADLMMVVGKELESYIKRITAVARFTGIHLVLATQRPSADVITGIIKSNMPSQIAFAVSNQVNSRIILDSTGAEKLLGRGDMLYSSASSNTPQRIQGAFIDTDEIEKIVDFVKSQGEPDYIDEAYFEDEEEEAEDEDIGTAGGGFGTEDLFMRAWKIVYERGEASASYLQRKLSIGYNRAATLIERMEDQGIIGPARGSKPREVIKAPESQKES